MNFGSFDQKKEQTVVSKEKNKQYTDIVLCKKNLKYN